MDLRTEKLQLIQQILQINDAILINSVKNLLAFGLETKEEKAEAVTDFWQGLNTKQKSQIELSIKQLDNQEGMQHKEAVCQPKGVCDIHSTP